MSKFVVSTDKKRFAKFRKDIRTLSLLYTRRGQAALSFVFLIGGIIILIGVTLAFLVVSFINSTYGFQFANQALAISSAGAEDALLKLARNKDYSSASYNVPLGSYSASVTVTQNSPVSGQATITSSATVFQHQRKIQVITAVDSSSGEISVVSWKLLTL